MVESPDDVSWVRVQDAVGPGFQVGRLIGRGGFAEVFAAEDVRLGRRVAIKVIRPDLRAASEVLERFQREARSVATVRHPNIVEIYAVGGGEGIAWFVMPLVQGESLGARLRREGVLAPEEATRILASAARALGAAHTAGIVHRDVKPDNILLDGPDGRVILADFGIAKSLGDGDASLTGSGFLVGTPQFMSPEQAAGEPVDQRSDIYALGVVGYRMIAGRLPFEGRSTQALLARILTQEPEPLRKVRPECPDVLVSVVGRALAKDPGERWADCAEMVRVLEGDVPPPPVGKRVGVSGWDRPGSAQGPASPAVPADPCRRFRREALVAVGGVVALGIADGALGLGGVSAWAGAGAVAALALRGGRLWSAGYSWTQILRPGLGAAGVVDTKTSASASGEEDFGRHRSLVYASVKARAAVLRAFNGLAHQEQERLPEFQDTVERLAARVRHVARKVVTLEQRIGEASARLEGMDSQETAISDSRAVARVQGRVRELAAARESAGEELRRVVGLLQELEDTVAESWREDPSAATEKVLRLLAAARAELAA